MLLSYFQYNNNSLVTSFASLYIKLKCLIRSDLRNLSQQTSLVFNKTRENKIILYVVCTSLYIKFLLNRKKKRPVHDMVFNYIFYPNKWSQLMYLAFYLIKGELLNNYVRISTFRITAQSPCPYITIGALD